MDNTVIIIATIIGLLANVIVIISFVKSMVDKLENKLENKIDNLEEKLNDKIDRLADKIEPKINEIDKEVFNLKYKTEDLSNKYNSLDNTTKATNIQLAELKYSHFDGKILPRRKAFVIKHNESKSYSTTPKKEIPV
ncbi:MAG: hypothetical protein LBQ34_03280 [Alphaproteobacteria bacterium]|jgi:predicted  nucleic acid-binding Zn-ribbon protein|nr:hypothetical protein [Alphaproteobacteria bacterium]